MDFLTFLNTVAFDEKSTEIKKLKLQLDKFFYKLGYQFRDTNGNLKRHELGQYIHEFKFRRIFYFFDEPDVDEYKFPIFAKLSKEDEETILEFILSTYTNSLRLLNFFAKDVQKSTKAGFSWVVLNTLNMLISWGFGKDLAKYEDQIMIEEQLVRQYTPTQTVIKEYTSRKINPSNIIEILKRRPYRNMPLVLEKICSE